MIFHRLILIGVIVSVVSGCRAVGEEPHIERPNIIYILADDLGYGDLSCYGQQRFQTPNLDRMAAQGMKFTQHYAGSTVCAPSRSSLMTGLTTGRTPIRGNKEHQPEGQFPIDSASFTIAEMLKAEGYATGGFGKWGLGYPGSEGDPNFQGFDYFYGYNCQRYAHNYYPPHLWKNQEKVMLKGNVNDKFTTYAPDLIQKEALSFIENNKDRPFFMYYAHVIPHAELLLPEKYMKEFRGKFDPERSYVGAEPGDHNFRTGAYGTQPESHAAFAAMVVLLDQHVGEVLKKLEELELERKTIVIFTSDNGPHVEGGGDPDYFNSNGPLRGYKRDLYDGGIRVPMITWWPGQIQAGSTLDHVSAFWDVMPTLADVAGAETPDGIDGISFLPALLDKGDQLQHSYLYWEFHELGGRQAVRRGNWKLIRYNVFDSKQTTTELYDLTTDLAEQNNVAKENPEVVREILEIMKDARVPAQGFAFPLVSGRVNR